MAPGYRANNQSRRQNRGYVDHDVFEGLPVRNWRRDTITVAPPPAHEVATQKDKWDVELPWGLPKDSHLLPQHSQDLLRAARSGRLYVKRKAAEEEEAENENANANAAAPAAAEKPEKKELVPKEEGFSVKTWKLVPRHQEGPEMELLAKRRKVVKGSTQRNVVSGPPLTKATVRRTDAAGNTYVEDLVVAEGQTVEGEVISQTVISGPAAAGGEALPVVPTPPRRRPPPPKRKAKGPGRGRKKKLPLPPTSVPAGTGEANGEGQIQADGTTSSAVGPDGVKLEGSATPANENEDTEMGDDSIIPSDEDGEDGEEGEEGDEGDEDEDQEGEGEGDEDGAEGEGEGQAGETDQDETPERKLDISEADITPPIETGMNEFQPSLNDNGHQLDAAQTLPGHLTDDTAALNGSPLKQVMTQSSYPPHLDLQEASGFSNPTGDIEMQEPIEYEHPEGTTVADTTGLNVDMSSYANPQNEMGGFQPMETQQQHLGADDFQTAQSGGLEHDGVLEGDHIPPFDVEGAAASTTADEHPDEMLLDQVENIPAAPVGVESAIAIEEQPPHPEIDTLAAPMSTPVPGFPPPPQKLPDDQTLAAPAPLDTLPPTTAPPPAAQEEDKFEDLLGSLEDHLDATGTTGNVVADAAPPTATAPPPAPVPAPAELAEAPTVEGVAESLAQDVAPTADVLPTQGQDEADVLVPVPVPISETSIAAPVEDSVPSAADKVDQVDEVVGTDVQTDVAAGPAAALDETVPEVTEAVPAVADVPAAEAETGAEGKPEGEGKVEE